MIFPFIVLSMAFASAEVCYLHEEHAGFATVHVRWFRSSFEVLLLSRACSVRRLSLALFACVLEEKTLVYIEMSVHLKKNGQIKKKDVHKVQYGVRLWSGEWRNRMS